MGSILALGAAPAIVRADSLMRIVPRDMTLDLTEASLEAAIIAMRTLTDDRGILMFRKMGYDHIQRRIVTTPVSWREATKAMDAQCSP